MKNIFKINLKLLSVAFILLGLTSCSDDDLDGLDPQPKPVATTTVTSLTIAEGESGVIPFTISQAISKPSQFKIELVGGTGDQEDIMAGDQETDGDTGIIGDGFEITVPAFAQIFDIPVSAMLDLDQSEGNETITLKISAAGVRTILTPQDYFVTVSIQDYQYCTWTFEMTDSYGDGWNGGHLDVTADGVTTSYACQNLDGAVNLSETQIVDVPIELGANYTITYVSGGGTGNGPGWESENSYTLTSPNGTIFSDGPIPTEGVVTSGTSMCN